MTTSTHRARTAQFHAFADWMTEDVAQRLYAARQDLADAAAERPADAPEIDAVRDSLMAIVRSLHDTATLLREHDAATMPADRVEALAGRVERDCLDAEAVMARGISLIARPATATITALAPRRAVRGDGPFAERSAARHMTATARIARLG